MSIQPHHQNQIDNFAASLPRQLGIIPSSSSSMQDFLSKFDQIQAASQDKLSHFFGKLSEKIQKMLLIISSRGDVVPTKLKDNAMAFFSLLNFQKPNKYLESLLESKGAKCSIPTAPGKCIWTRKVDIKSAFRQLHLDAITAFRSAVPF